MLCLQKLSVCSGLQRIFHSRERAFGSFVQVAIFVPYVRFLANAHSYCIKFTTTLNNLWVDVRAIHKWLALALICLAVFTLSVKR